LLSGASFSLDLCTSSEEYGFQLASIFNLFASGRGLQVWIALAWRILVATRIVERSSIRMNLLGAGRFASWGSAS